MKIEHDNERASLLLTDMSQRIVGINFKARKEKLVIGPGFLSWSNVLAYQHRPSSERALMPGEATFTLIGLIAVMIVGLPKATWKQGQGQWYASTGSMVPPPLPLRPAWSVTCELAL